jgi:hypothetical protein
MLTPIQVTMKVIKALEVCGINYFIGGSLGSSIYGIPRATMDADLISEMDPVKINAFVELLKDDFYIDPDMIHEAVKNQGCFNAIHLGTMFKVDVFILKDNAYEREELYRRKIEQIHETGDLVHLASPEDIILNKLLWYKQAGGVSERQWQDAKGVLKIQARFLDFNYLNRWAKILEIDDLWKKLRHGFLERG